MLFGDSPLKDPLRDGSSAAPGAPGSQETGSPTPHNAQDRFRLGPAFDTSPQSSYRPDNFNSQIDSQDATNSANQPQRHQEGVVAIYPPWFRNRRLQAFGAFNLFLICLTGWSNVPDLVNTTGTKNRRHTCTGCHQAISTQKRGVLRCVFADKGFKKKQGK